MDIVLERLSHWGRVAFAARCARRAMPLFDRGWPEASAERRKELEQTIRLTELSVVNGTPTEGLKAASLNAAVIAGAAICRHLYGKDGFEEIEETPVQRSLAELASLAANVVRHAADAGLGDNDRQLERSRDAYHFLLNAVHHGDQIGLIELIEQDYLDCLQRFPRRPWWKFW